MEINDRQKEELPRLAQAATLKNDMRYLNEHRHNPLLVNGKVDIDRWITFLSEYNEFINHSPKPFRQIIDRIMKL